MEEKVLLTELTKNCNGKKEKVIELLKIYDLAELGRDVQRQQFKDVENQVLQEHEFYCRRDGMVIRSDDQPKQGERILDESWTFLMSDEDFHRYQDTLLPYYVKEGLTDEKGYYVTNWDMIVCDARNKLVSFIIDEIVPKSIAEIFRKNIHRIMIQEKLIKITKEAFWVAA